MKIEFECSKISGHDLTPATGVAYEREGESSVRYLTLYCKRCGNTKEIVASDTKGAH